MEQALSRPTPRVGLATRLEGPSGASHKGSHTVINWHDGRHLHEGGSELSSRIWR